MFFRCFLLYGVLFFFMIFLNPTAGRAAVIHVPGDYPTIQAGIDAATDGDTVLVADGTYCGTGNKEIDLRGKLITVASENGPENCVIDCENNGRGFHVMHGETPPAEIRGFTIQHGYIHGNFLTGRGGGIYLEQTSPTIRNCIIQNCRALRGSGICCAGQSPLIIDCHIIDNDGSGVHSQNSNVTIQNCEIRNNAENGVQSNTPSGPQMTIIDSNISDNGARGVYCDTLTMDNCSVTDNAGGGIYCNNGMIHNCIISHNSAESGGGIYSKYIVLTNCTISYNQASKFGGGLRCISGIIGGDTESSNIFESNRAPAGADILCADFTPDIIDATFNHFSGNPYSDYYVSPVSTFDLTGCTYDIELIHQDVYVSPDGDDTNDGLSPDHPFRTIQYALSRVAVDPPDSRTIHLAPGTYSSNTTGEQFPLPLMPNLVLEGDEAEETILDGDGSETIIFTFKDDNARLEHLVMFNGINGAYLSETSMSVSQCHVRYNADVGIYIDYFSQVLINNSVFSGNKIGILAALSNISVIQCEIKNNTGSELGGGIYAWFSDDVVIDSCRIHDNTSLSRGGGLLFDKSNVTITNSYIMNNNSSTGGGIALENNVGASFFNCLIAGNIASDNGGGVSTYNCKASIFNCTFVQNTSSAGGGLYCNNSTGDHHSVSLNDCILWDNVPNQVAFRTIEPIINYSDIQGGYSGTGNFDSDPLFITGPNGDYYLSQIAAGQTENSPCLDSGHASADSVCFDMPYYLICMQDLTTRIDESTDQNVVDIGFHYFPATFSTPTPSPTPSPTPTATSTPVCPGTGCRIEMPSHMFFPGMTCYCDVNICNSTATLLKNIPIFVILEIGGEYLFAPGFGEFDMYIRDIKPGLNILNVIPEFTWPAGVGSMDQATWYAAMTDPEITEIIGTMDIFSFGWKSSE